MKLRLWIKQLLPVIVLLVTLVLVFPNCGKTSESARRARGLKQERLVELHKEMENLLSIPKPEGSLSFAYTTSNDAQGIPIAFADLDCKVVSPYAHPPFIRLAGCFDEAVDLVFYGVPGDSIYGQESRRVVLQFKGRDDPEEVLWSREGNE